MKKLVLASKSPRRKEILKKAVRKAQLREEEILKDALENQLHTNPQRTSLQFLICLIKPGPE